MADDSDFQSVLQMVNSLRHDVDAMKSDLGSKVSEIESSISSMGRELADIQSKIQPKNEERLNNPPKEQQYTFNEDVNEAAKKNVLVGHKEEALGQQKNNGERGSSQDGIVDVTQAAIAELKANMDANNDAIGKLQLDMETALATKEKVDAVIDSNGTIDATKIEVSDINFSAV